MELELLPLTTVLATVEPPKILIVEDDTTMEPLWTHVIEQVHPDSAVQWVTTEEAAENVLRNRILRRRSFDVVISDVFLSGHRTGIDLWRRYGGGTSMFLLISVISPEKFATMIGPNDLTPFYLQKPLDPEECIDALQVMLAYKALKGS